MKFDIPRIVRAVPLRDYAPEYGEHVIWMWVNPPRAKRQAFAGIAAQWKLLQKRLTDLGAETGAGDSEELTALVETLIEQGRLLYAWWAEMWSQGDDPDTHWTAEEVQEMAEAALDSDMGLWEYMQDASLEAVQAYREQKKSN